MKAKNLAAVALFCASASLYAIPVNETFATSGVFNATTPTSSWTAPNAIWSITFTVASHPLVNSFVIGDFFDVPFTNFVYMLNGTPVNVGPVDIAFYSTADGGLLNIAFFGGSAVVSEPNGFELFGPQAYTGPESAPTFVQNGYLETRNLVVVGGTTVTEAIGFISIALAFAPTPAPPTLLLALTGLGFVAAFLLTSRQWARA